MRIKYCFGLLLLFAWSCIGENNDNCGRVFEVSVRVDIDWGSISPQPGEMKLIFFPEDGSLPFSRYVDHSGQVIEVPGGEYRMLFYNWMSSGDVQRIAFAGEGSFAAAEAYTDFRSLATFTEQVLVQPDSLYAWSSGNSLVTIPESGTEPFVLQTRPVSLVRHYDFFIPAEGLEYVRSAEAVISGAARDVYLSDGEVFGPGNLMSVSVSRAPGGFRCHFSAFGFVGGQQNIFHLRLTLVDGSRMDVETDLTAEIAKGTVGDFTTVVKVPYTAAGGGFTDPGFEDWKEIYEKIPI